MGMMNSWAEQYDKKHRPGQKELAAYLPGDVMALFERFAEQLARRFKLSCAPAVYTSSAGWVFRFGRSGLYLFDGITVGEDGFRVEGICVCDEASLAAVLALAQKRFNDGFGEVLNRHCAQKSAAQGQATKRRLEREKSEIAAMSERIVKERFNRYHWSPKVPRRGLRQLYEQDARRIEDEELVDEIGYALYARCLQGRDERALIESGRIKCHGCGAVLPYQAGLIECACGQQYLFRDYMRAFRANNMPSGSAAHIFQAFIGAWPRAAGYAQKMRLVDNLVHEFHINLVTGVKGRFVGINLIEGTKKQIAELILSLAGEDEAKEQFRQKLRGKS